MTTNSVSGIAVVLAVLFVAGGLANAPGAAASPGVTANSARAGWINISAVNQYGYSPANLQQVPTDATIAVTFTDQSPMEHTFTVIDKEGWVVPSSYSQEQVNELAFGAHAAVLVNLNVSGPGDQNHTTFVSPGPGWYEFICTVSGHFALGMYGFIAFGMNLPSNLTQSNRTLLGGGIPFSTTEAIVVGAFVAVAALAYLAVRRLQSRAREEREESDHAPP